MRLLVLCLLLFIAPIFGSDQLWTPIHAQHVFARIDVTATAGCIIPTGIIAANDSLVKCYKSIEEGPEKHLQMILTANAKNLDCEVSVRHKAIYHLATAIGGFIHAPAGSFWASLLPLPGGWSNKHDHVKYHHNATVAPAPSNDKWAIAAGPDAFLREVTACQWHLGVNGAEYAPPHRFHKAYKHLPTIHFVLKERALALDLPSAH